MKIFFTSSFFFWVTCRSIFVLIGAISLIGLTGHRMKPAELMVNTIIAVYLILMAVNAVREIGNFAAYRITRYITGVLSLLFGSGLFALICIMSNKGGLIGFLGIFMSMIIVLLGLFDVLQINRTTTQLFKDGIESAEGN